MNIKVVEYDPNWKTEYLKEEQAIKGILQDELVKSFHIGSTSVPNLKAKPIIDILLVVNDIGKLDQYTAPFENFGYEVMGEFGMKGRRYFRKGGDDRTHQIHAFQYDSIQEIERHLSFRDYLCENPEICKAYGELKSKLADKYPTDIESYGDGKDEFVKKIERAALKWHWTIR
ncbi:GrpB family protein [Cohnella sp. REN36]|uniref:GrpB family protein n=1 Tax=Cohnella sp. REN36 TaxID=2887347 RepID=UPI001D148DF0|nr:GrpB family protein [Cohnella sp. REN36]MCC3373589.1 GrpB family protein [Cohnella sp. REN36]